MSEKIEKKAIILSDKAKNRIRVLSHHFGCDSKVNNNQLVHNTTCMSLKTSTGMPDCIPKWVIEYGNCIIFVGQVVDASKTIITTGIDVVCWGKQKYDEFQECRRNKRTYAELKELVENKFKTTGSYLDQESLNRLSSLILIHKMRVSEDVFKRLQRQCAINLLRYPYYLQDDYEKVCIDLNYNRDDLGNPEKILNSKIYKSQPENKDAIRNMNDVFLSALKRSEVALTKKFMKFKITYNDHKLLSDAIEQAKKFDYSKPITMYTSPYFNNKYSTNHKRQVDYLKNKEESSKKENEFSNNATH